MPIMWFGFYHGTDYSNKKNNIYGTILQQIPTLTVTATVAKQQPQQQITNQQLL